jgi:hypothetical protein
LLDLLRIANSSFESGKGILLGDRHRAAQFGRRELGMAVGSGWSPVIYVPRVTVISTGFDGLRRFCALKPFALAIVADFCHTACPHAVPRPMSAMGRFLPVATTLFNRCHRLAPSGQGLEPPF